MKATRVLVILVLALFSLTAVQGEEVHVHNHDQIPRVKLRLMDGIAALVEAFHGHFQREDGAPAR